MLDICFMYINIMEVLILFQPNFTFFIRIYCTYVRALFSVGSQKGSRCHSKASAKNGAIFYPNYDSYCNT